MKELEVTTYIRHVEGTTDEKIILFNYNFVITMTFYLPEQLLSSGNTVPSLQV